MFEFSFLFHKKFNITDMDILSSFKFVTIESQWVSYKPTHHDSYRTNSVFYQRSGKLNINNETRHDNMPA